MKTYDAIRIAARNAGMSLRGLGRAYGKTDGYIVSAISRGNTPKTDTTAGILATCGYALCAVPADNVPEDALVIDPPATETVDR